MVKATNADGPRPLDPELWRRTLAAVRSAAAAADAELARGGWRPRVSLPRVSSFDSGWPRLSGPTGLPADDAPTDHSALFGPSRGTLKPIAYGDVPELVALVGYVRGRTDLKDRMTVETPAGGSERQDWLLEYEAVHLALSLLDRARATGTPLEEEGLLPLYLQRERAWLLDPLPVEYLFPLAMTAFDLDSRLAIDDVVRIDPLDAAMQAARAPGMSSIGGVPDPVVGAATHAIVVSGRELRNPGPGPRLVGRDEETVPFDEADLVCESLRVVTHADLGYAQVLRRPLGWADHWLHDLPAVTTVSTVRRYPDSFDQYAWLQAASPIPQAALQQVPLVVSALRNAQPHVRLASRRLSLAAARSADDDRAVDACIGLEALLGKERDELSHRLGLRAAAVLGSREGDPADPVVVYDLVKKVYKHRSAVVHGTIAAKYRDLTVGDQTYSAATVAVMLLREILLDALTRRDGWSPESLDSALLIALRPGHAGSDAHSGPEDSEGGS